jgi:hypothetical protein
MKSFPHDRRPGDRSRQGRVLEVSGRLVHRFRNHESTAEDPPPQPGEELLQGSKSADLAAEHPPEQQGGQHRRKEKYVTALGDPLDRSTRCDQRVGRFDGPEGAQGVDPDRAGASFATDASNQAPLIGPAAQREPPAAESGTYAAIACHSYRMASIDLHGNSMCVKEAAGTIKRLY